MKATDCFSHVFPLLVPTKYFALNKTVQFSLTELPTKLTKKKLN